MRLPGTLKNSTLRVPRSISVTFAPDSTSVNALLDKRLSFVLGMISGRGPVSAFGRPRACWALLFSYFAEHFFA